MKQFFPLWLVAMAAVTLIASLPNAGLSAPSARARASATTEQIDRFQLEVLAAINCEELALQPALSDELARSWMLCSLYSLYDARSLAQEAGLTEVSFQNGRTTYIYSIPYLLGLAKEDDLAALRKHPLDREKIR